MTDSTEPILAAVQNDLPRLRALVHVTKSGGYPHFIHTPGEALDLALKIKDGLREARRSYGNIGTVHLFLAAPAGLAALLGQCLNTFAQVQTYEHVAVSGSDRYRAAALLHPSA